MEGAEKLSTESTGSLKLDATETDGRMSVSPSRPKTLDWDELKVVYNGWKLGRRNDSHFKGTPAVWNGKLFDGLEIRCGNILVDQDYVLEDQSAEGFIPKIGACVTLMASRWNSGYNYIRTSLIEDFYIHEDETETSKDKIVMRDPENLKLLDKIEKWEKGDILLVTMNSLYYLKAIPNK